MGKAGTGKPKEDNDSTFFFWTVGVHIIGSAAPIVLGLSNLQASDLVSLPRKQARLSRKKISYGTPSNSTCVSNCSLQIISQLIG